MWSDPVTLGGGMTMLKRGLPDAASALKAPIDSQKAGIQVIATAPYRNVVRMHLLIFFFAFASAMGLDSFGVYAVVFAVYFFPWRTLFRRPGSTVPTATP
jgi:hypothetical protein